jgi:hypothetical protein
VAALLVCGAAAWLLISRDQQQRPPTDLERAFARTSAKDLAASGAFRWRRSADAEFMRRGRDGLGHPLYAETRGGVERTASVMDRLSPYFERFGRAAGVDPLTLAAVVMVESGGRADLTEEPDSSVGRAGLAGLNAGEAQAAGLRVNEKKSDDLTRRIDRVTTRQTKIEKKSEAAKLDPELIAMRAKRRKVDERFDVRRAIEAAASILRQGQKALGREDLAVAAYAAGPEEIARFVKRAGGGRVTYPELFLGGPAEGSENGDFPFLVAAARQILVLYAKDPSALYDLATRHGTKPGAEDVLRPPGRPPSYPDHEAIQRALDAGELVALPDDPGRTGFELGSDPDSRRVFATELHRLLRPGALAVLMYVAGSARDTAGGDLTLELAGAVRPETGKQRLEAAARGAGEGVVGPGPALSSKYVRPPASTGYSFELRRNLDGEEQAPVDAVLARLRALDVIEVVHDGDIDRVTVGPRAGELLDFVRRGRR